VAPRQRESEQDCGPGLGVPVTVRLSPRARRIGLSIDEARRGVVLVLPRHTPLRQGLRFVEAQRGWITARVAALPERVPFAEGAMVPILGVPHQIRRELDPVAPPVAIKEGEIRVRGDPLHLSRRVRDHLAATARREFARRAGKFAARLGHKVTRIAVRDTVSRWGSCSGKGRLSFSWRLILAPERVLDYVVAHEVAHLAEMNHGPRFWRLVESLAPGRAAPRGWLRRHRSRLLSYG
jgi:predicted metal-dependent hydrolase